MKTVFLLEHSYNNGEYEISNIIGIYSTIEKVNLTLEKYKNHPRLMDYPESFKVHQYVIDQPKILELVT
jgi:hypothetical protein